MSRVWRRSGEALCEVVHDVHDVKTSVTLPKPPGPTGERTVDAAVVAARTSSCRACGVVNHRVSPSDRSCHRRDLSRPPSSLKDARAAGFLAPVAPLTFALRCSRLMSFLSYVVGASTWLG